MKKKKKETRKKIRTKMSMKMKEKQCSNEFKQMLNIVISGIFDNDYIKSNQVFHAYKNLNFSSALQLNYCRVQKCVKKEKDNIESDRIFVRK